MSKSTNQTVQVGPGAATCLTILFVLLKVFGYINWNWWWVFAPMWIGAAILIAILAIILAFSGVIFAVAFVMDAVSRK